MSHGGLRPIEDAGDGRLAPNRILDVASPSHHDLAPGRWLPHARVLVEEDPVAWMGPAYSYARSEFANEDLMPKELRSVRRRRALEAEERRQILGS